MKKRTSSNADTDANNDNSAAKRPRSSKSVKSRGATMPAERETIKPYITRSMDKHTDSETTTHDVQIMSYELVVASTQSKSHRRSHGRDSRDVHSSSNRDTSRGRPRS